jgi:rubredoxin
MTDLPKYQCNICGYVYDPAVGDSSQSIEPGTPFEELPEDWTCPECGAGKEEFTQL